MKRVAMVSCVVLALVLFAKAQGQSQSEKGLTAAPGQTIPSQTKISPAKEADIRKLLELSGGKNLAGQMMDSMSQNIKPLVTNSLPPGDYRERLVDLFFEKFRAKANTQNLVEMAVPLYDKYLTADEIKGLIQFYGTPLGQKAVSVLPKLTAEMQQQGRAWGEQLGRDSMMEVLNEHPDLKSALEEAARRAQAK
jgi:hypothetical protein